MAYSYDPRSYSTRRQEAHMSRSQSVDPHPRPGRYSYDPHYYPSIRTSAPSSPTHYPRPEARTTRRWPPSPSVEDEADSLARELGGTTLDSNGGEACMRGAVDQEPLLLEVEQPQNTNAEKRFVLVPNDRRQDTPESDAVRRSRRASDKPIPPPIRTDLEETPVFTRREPSPYAYSRSTKSERNQSSSESFLSPDPIAPSSARLSAPTDQHQPPETSRRTAIPSASQPSKEGKTSKWGYDSKTSDESDLDQSEIANLRSRRQPARYSFTKVDLQKPNLRTSLHDAAETYDRPPPASSSPRHSAPSSSKQSSASSTSTSHAPSPRTTPVSRTAPGESISGISGRRYSSRPSSPVYLESAYTASPPRSPRLDARRDDYTPVAEPGSRPGSRKSSRPSSPVSWASGSQAYITSNLDLNSPDRQSTYPLASKSRPKPPSRLSSLVPQESTLAPSSPRDDSYSSSSARRPKALPYPEDHQPQLMPSEERFQHQPSSPRTSIDGGRKHFRTPSGGSALSPLTPLVSRMREGSSSRPTLASRHTVGETIPQLASESTRLPTRNSLRRDSSQLSSALSVTRPLPACHRSEASSKYDDWYVLDGCPGFHVCPDCLDLIIGRTPYQRYFKRARRRSLGARTKCDFSSPWVRLAWLMSLKQQRQSLDLLYSIASIVTSDLACPGDSQTSGLWYSLLDSYGDPIPDLYICARDVKSLEALFPSLRGSFAAIYQRDPRVKHLCSLRAPSRTFAPYLDCLAEIDERALRKGQPPDTRRLAQMVRENATRHACPRDNLVLNQAFYIVPALPEFTVCEDCYDEVVFPALVAGSAVAGQFATEMRVLPGQQSCQLYSPRMRRVWQRAVEDADLIYLAKKARERKRIEVELQAQHKALLELMGKRDSGVAYAGAYAGGMGGEPRVSEELEKIRRAWKDWE